MATSTEVLPVGNEWEFSARNDFEGLQPGPRRRENIQPTGLLLDVATHVQERFVVRGWHLVTLVEDLQQLNDRTPPHLMVIFTHTTRIALVDRWPRDIDQFINAGARKAADSRSEDGFNESKFYC